MDDRNPAVANQLAIPPAMFEEVEKDPRAIGAWARKLQLVHMHVMHNRLRDQSVPLSVRQQFLEYLAKVGGTDAKAAQTPATQGSGFSVNIVLNNPTTPLPKVEIVEAAPKEIAGE